MRVQAAQVTAYAGILIISAGRVWLVLTHPAWTEAEAIVRLWWWWLAGVALILTGAAAFRSR